jgi:hypothetical protein
VLRKSLETAREKTAESMENTKDVLSVENLQNPWKLLPEQNL